jgi:hypothetical protein
MNIRPATIKGVAYILSMKSREEIAFQSDSLEMTLTIPCWLAKNIFPSALTGDA